MMNSKNNIRTVAAVVAVMALHVSCSDKWDDHYNAGVQDGGAALWEALSARPDLSRFTHVVEACGYDVALSGSQGYTVFAPTNDCLTERQADSLAAEYDRQRAEGIREDENTVVRQFLQNHIALYKHPVSSLTHDTITMMNGKYQTLTAASVGNAGLLSANELCGNGVLFSVDRQVSYFPNVMEYLGQDAETDSVYAFLSRYNVYEFQAEKSVPGGIVDGQTVYLDSVMELQNPLLTLMGQLNSEDSTYWMLAPTNSEWEKYVAEYEPYFNYDNAVNGRDSMQYANARIALIGGSVFSRTENPDEAFRDSAVSTQASSALLRKYYGIEPYYIYYRPFDAGGIFDGAEDVECSNGHVMKTSQYRIGKYDTFLQTIRVEAELTANQDTLIDAYEPLTVYEVAETNPFYNLVSGHSFVDVVPETPDASPQVVYSVPGVLSNVGYDIYAVFAPVLAYDTLASAENRLPNAFKVEIRCHDQNGKATIPKRINTRFITTPDVVDSVLIASNLAFPTSSYGLGENQVTVRLSSNVGSSETSKYSRTMHLDCILFVPHGKGEAIEVRKTSNNNLIR